jgi:uncharacterized protein (DUF2147 family)
MKSNLVALAVVPLLSIAAPAMAGGPMGVWKSPSRAARIEIVSCASDSICGKLLNASRPASNPELLDIHNKDPERRQRTMIGQIVLDGFKGGPNKWTGGRVYNPGDGNYYTGVITLIDEQHLTLKGCALVFLCKSQTWERVE